jgi:c-di-GMP-binding flagellar brake protein YcgR
MDVIGHRNKISTSFIFTIYLYYFIHLSFESYVLQVMLFSIKGASGVFEESQKTAISFYNQNTFLIFSINRNEQKNDRQGISIFTTYLRPK